MKFSCDQCQAQYMIADEKVGPKGVKVRCKKCGHIISVTKEAALQDAAAATSQAFGGQAEPAQAPGSAFDDIFGGNTGGGDSGGADEARAPTKVFSTSELERVRQEQHLAKSGDMAASSGAAPSDEEPPTAQMPLQARPEWYLAIHDEQIGPITLDDVQARWDKGEVQPTTLGWRAGQADWSPVSQIAELAAVISRPQAAATQSKAAAVAAEAAKPVEPEKPKETVTWRPSGASALADLAKEATVEQPKPAAAPEAPSPVPDFNPAPAADPFGGFNSAGPSTVWQFPTTTAKKSNGGSKVLIAAVVVFGTLVVGGGVLYALGIIPPKPQYATGMPGQPTQPAGQQAVVTPPPASQPVATPPPQQAATPTPTPTPAVASAGRPKKGGSRTPKGGGDDGADAPEEKPVKQAKPSGGSDPMDELLGGGKSRAEVKATLGRDDVLGVVKSNLGGVQKCASAYSAGGGKLPPKLILKWVIKPSGYTEGHELANPDLKGTQVDSCVVAALKKWRFPEYREGNIPVTYPVTVSQ